MKKFLLMIAVAAMAFTASAQNRVTLSTYSGTQVDKYVGQQCDVTMNRYLITGWNTFALPFAMSEQELEQVIGQDFKLESLVGVNQRGNEIELCFQDCKAQGIEAGKPYILYYTGETATKKFALSTAITSPEASLTLTTQDGVQVTMSGAALKTDGRDKYGILAVDNSEARFTYVDDDKVFYATRCFITTSGIEHYTLTTRHLAAGETTSITDIVAGNEIVDVYNILGMRVATGIQATDVNNLEPNIYIVNGRKVLVK